MSAPIPTNNQPESTPADAPKASPTPPSDEPNADGKPELTLDQALAELEKARKQAARYRNERNELKPLADKHREAEEATKTEAQKASERIAALEAENQTMLLAAKRAELAASTGVPADLLRGSTIEELTEHAEALKTALDAKAAEATPPAGVIVHGENSGGTPLQEHDWLRRLMGT